MFGLVLRAYVPLHGAFLALRPLLLKLASKAPLHCLRFRDGEESRAAGRRVSRIEQALAFFS
jgi:hypothetical protein